MTRTLPEYSIHTVLFPAFYLNSLNFLVFLFLRLGNTDYDCFHLVICLLPHSKVSIVCTSCRRFNNVGHVFIMTVNKKVVSLAEYHVHRLNSLHDQCPTPHTAVTDVPAKLFCM